LSITITTLSATINYWVNNTVYISIYPSLESIDTDLSRSIQDFTQYWVILNDTGCYASLYSGH